ncbi:MAG: DUF3048 domain-containing protein [Clostridiaceae bacterium]|jgi:uncharacterized protein YxeA|nr:DUF3048 domain-containing protein [Clostridiaceae bacterium]
MKKILTKIVTVLIILTMILTVACNKKTEEEEETVAESMLPVESEEVSESSVEATESEMETKALGTEVSETESEAYAKFSGLPTTEVRNNLRPIAVMLDNHPDARMHAGIRQADMVFEMRVEGTYTRYMALFHSQDAELLGPIRSARKYYIERMNEFEAGYAHVGGSSEATEILATGNYIDLDAMIAPPSAMWRYFETGKVAPHNMYGSTESLREFMQQIGYEETNDTEGYLFNQTAEKPNGEKAEEVSVSYFADNNSLFRYVPETQTYSLTKDGVEQVDENDQEPFEIVNIIIQEAVYYPHPTIGGILTLDHFGEGTGYYISQGEYIPITWVKEDLASRTKYYRDGEELKLNPGQTWILVTEAETLIDFGD